MFNFNLQNKAFEELNAEQFRLVYFLNNTLSMVNETTKAANNNTIEMFNGYMMDKLGLSVRQIQRLIKSVEDAGYIIVDRAKTKKQPNKITIINATNSDKNGDKNVTLNNNATINGDKNVTLNNNATINSDKNVTLNNNITLNCDKNDDKNGDKNVTLNKNEIKNNKNKNTCIHEHEEPEDKKENIIKEKVNEMKNAVLNEMEREVEKDNKNITSTYGDKNTNSNLKIDDKTGCNNSTVTEDDELFNKVFGLSSTGTQNKGACDVENTSIDNLSTSTEKTQQEGLKTQNNAYSLQEWMTEYNKLILQVENTDVEDDSFNSILDEGAKLFESFPKNEGNYRSAMQDLRYWVVRKLDFNKTFKISERWNRYYRIA